MTVSDPLPGLVGFATALREAGLPAGPQRVQAYLDAVERVDLTDTGQLYWAGRLTLCADPDDLPRYDDLCDSYGYDAIELLEKIVDSIDDDSP